MDLQNCLLSNQAWNLQLRFPQNLKRVATLRNLSSDESSQRPQTYIMASTDWHGMLAWHGTNWWVAQTSPS